MKKIFYLLFTFTLIVNIAFSQKIYTSPSYNELKITFQKVFQNEMELEKAGPLLEQFSILKTENKVEDWQAGLIVEYKDFSVISSIQQIGGMVRTVTENQMTVFVPVSKLDEFEKIAGISRVSAGMKEQYHNSQAVSAHYPAVPQNAGYSGTDVICGVVDSGIDFTHPMFKKSNGDTRIINIWDQTDATGPAPSGYAYGTEYTEAQINQDLDAGGNHSVVAQVDDNGHGTHVTGSVAGYDSALVAVSDTSFQGASIDANIIFVKTTMYTDAINDGVNYIFQKAAALGKPAVVNLSLGSQVGPHDGTDQYTEQLDQMVGAGKIVVRSAGNDGDADIHNRLTVNNGVEEDVYYYVSSNAGYLWLDT
ncbi:MAG: S8 family serine peptidase, partial [Calditrichia bacterium]|nr:S8 family serine peptidase [Calditrichia bacterium]